MTYGPYQAYKRVNVETASQGQLVVMLFNAALKCIAEAKDAINDHDIQRVHNKLVRAQDIVAEIRGALNMQTGDIARNLDRIYEYFQHLLIQANIYKTVEPLNLCSELMSAMRDTWEQVFRQAAPTDSVPPPPPPVSPRSSLINVEG